MADVSISIGVVLSELKAGLAEGSSMLDKFTKESKKAREGVFFFSQAIRDITGAASPAGTALSSMLAGFAMGGAMGLAMAGIQGLVGWVKQSRVEAERLNAELDKTARAAQAAANKTHEMAVALRHGADAGNLVRNQNAIADASARVADIQQKIDAKQAELNEKKASFVRYLPAEEALAKEILALTNQRAEAEERVRQASLQMQQDQQAAATRTAERNTAAADKAAAQAAQKAQADEAYANRLFEIDYNLRQQREQAEVEYANRLFEIDYELQQQREEEQKARLQAQVQTYTSFGQRIGSTFGTALAQGMTPAKAVKAMLKDIMGAMLDMVSKSIMAKALDAGAGAAASQSSIPIAGPGLAAAAMAAMIALVKGLLGGLPSAAGGWDIPNVSGGINAVVHGGEMVLPRVYADRIRAMTDPQQQGAVSVVLNLSAVDAKSVERLFRDNDASLLKVLTEAIRDGR